MFIIYGTPKCSFCISAKKLLEKYELHYEYFNVLDSEATKDMFRAEGFKTVPQIYDQLAGGVKHIGGYEDLEKYLKQPVKAFND